MLPSVSLPFLAGALLTCSQSLASPSASEITKGCEPLVDLGYARYRGTHSVDSNVTSFLGIRFAASPEGDMRWSAPQQPLYEEGVQDASRPPPMCYQASMGVARSSPWVDISAHNTTTRAFSRRQETVIESEDCLFLNVYAPADANQGKGRFPVVVWIHGGGYILGSASRYDGSYLVSKSNHNVIAVTIQYRLGVFGFLAGEEVRNGGQLNIGLLDQEFALRWVQEHIRKFGGDPSRVTIWGQSAGAGSVLQHVIARDGRASPALFDTAITSSLFLPPQYSYNHEIPQMLYDQIVEHADCAGEKSTLACLRSTDVATLAGIGVALTSAGFYGSYTFAPVVDGEFIVQPVSTALEQGKTNGAALLSVATSNEGFNLVDPNTTFSASEYTRQYFPTLSVNEAEWIGAAYEDFGTLFNQSSRIQAEGVVSQPGMAYLISLQECTGIAYYFGGYTFLVPPPPLFEADDFIDSFSKPFLDFVVFSDPNRYLNEDTKTPHWPEYDEDDMGASFEMYFGQSNDRKHADIHLAEVNRDLLERCRMWAELADRSGQ